MKALRGVATLGLYAVVVVLVVLAVTQQQVAVSTNHALCAFRDDLATRVESGRQFLLDNPKGIPGLPAETIQQSLDNQQRTLDALAALNCS